MDKVFSQLDEDQSGGLDVNEFTALFLDDDKANLFRSSFSSGDKPSASTANRLKTAPAVPKTAQVKPKSLSSTGQSGNSSSRQEETKSLLEKLCSHEGKDIEEVHELAQRCFTLLDADGSGKIEPKELAEVRERCK